jgi:hypothetical protein
MHLFLKACVVEILIVVIFENLGTERIEVGGAKYKTAYEFIWDTIFIQILILLC